MAEDSILALGLRRYGYGFWEMMRNDIRNDPRMSFNWLARSRSLLEIHKRCDQLIQRFKKEFIPDSNQSNNAKKSKQADSKATANASKNGNSSSQVTSSTKKTSKVLGKRKRKEESSQSDLEL